jgi:hypothetical protein
MEQRREQNDKNKNMQRRQQKMEIIVVLFEFIKFYE